MKKSKNLNEPPAIWPTREAIAIAAYSIWEQEGRPEGRAVEHWLEAEMQLRLSHTSSVTTSSPRR